MVFLSLVDFMYQQANVLRQYNKDEINYVFKVPLKHRQKYSLVALETWLKMATSVIETAEMRANSKLIQWLNREGTYQGNNLGRDTIDAIP